MNHRTRPLKTIGVLGGIGPQATMDFEAHVHAISRRLLEPQGNSGYPPLAVYYHRSPPVVLREDGEPVQPFQLDPLLLNAARMLAMMADFLVITSDSTRLMSEIIEEYAGLPVLSKIETTLEEVQRRGWKRVGVLTFRAFSMYNTPLREMGIIPETISAELASSLDHAIMALSAGSETLQDRLVAREAVEILRARDVDGIILGCTEIPLLLQEEAADLIDPLQLLAETAVTYALQ